MDTNKMRELKALAEAQPVQVWTRTRGRRPDMRGQPLMYGVDGPEGVSDYEDWGFTRKAAEYIAAASPATVLALLAEIERLGADRKACWEEFKVQGRQLDQLKAENQALRKNAERYTALRDNGYLDSWADVHVCDEHRRADLVDAAIDAAMWPRGVSHD